MPPDSLFHRTHSVPGTTLRVPAAPSVSHRQRQVRTERCLEPYRCTPYTVDVIRNVAVATVRCCCAVVVVLVVVVVVVAVDTEYSYVIIRYILNHLRRESNGLIREE